MSALSRQCAATSRAGAGASRKQLLSKGPGACSTVQTRSYAAVQKKAASKQGPNGFKGGRNQESQKKYKVDPNARIMQYKPLPAAQLASPLFQTVNPDPLAALPTFRADTLTRSQASRALAFADAAQDASAPFRVFGVQRRMVLEFRLLSRACSVVRGVTLDVVDRLDKAGQEGSKGNRLVLTGDEGCGKSFALLQATQYAAGRDWLVLYIPRGIDLVNSSTPYVYDARTQTYLQGAFALETLKRFARANAAKLNDLVTSTPVELEPRAVLLAGLQPQGQSTNPAASEGTVLPPGTPITQLIEIGTREASVAPAVLDSLLEQLGQQTKRPVLLAVDDFQAVYGKSAYKDPHFAQIRPWHLSMPRLILEYASGNKTFARGAVLGALSSSPHYPLPLELAESLNTPSHAPSSGPYVQRHATAQFYASGLETIPVPSKLSIPEAAALFSVRWKGGKEPGDEMFFSRYVESGGNARSFVWKGILGGAL
ncbi:hypothetical protein CONPUDRAFT_106866 [Coniophora puteana RWD-64-598 SS2]|uniref:Small ribosomal subunit protein mS29 n=1 Tax=Coniophora puteana (strain RWD-64-598) TaxID=741705 RepID=A0A5M3MHY4_CONPW|nr:uncharacterized protein CONPUDRAFT_106866 [Coniophora puteana RWD-64-598 SS2]EIW78848.1 hypothetical protein CONPUDRAFT_106866 [Coniophora puteana RWD-64-598 SS2]